MGAHNELWSARNVDAGEWRRHLDAYPQRLAELAQRKGKKELVDLDRWYRVELKKEVVARTVGQEQPHLLPEELSQIMKWKLSRGKFRPGLQGKADSNSAADTRTATARGFAAAKAVEELLSRGTERNSSAAISDSTEIGKETAVAIEAMSKGPPKLKGIGPATASALLAALSPCFPFMSDEAAMASLGAGKLRYDLKEYLLFSAALRTKARELNGNAENDLQWTAVDVERALWSASQCQKEVIAKNDERPRKKIRK